MTVKMDSKAMHWGRGRVCFLLPWGNVRQRVDAGAHVQEEGREENGTTWKLVLLEECGAGKGSREWSGEATAPSHYSGQMTHKRV